MKRIKVFVSDCFFIVMLKSIEAYGYIIGTLKQPEEKE
jgi:hypothetical protein